MSRRVLLLCSYCGEDNPECSDDSPCVECLQMCNVAEVDGEINVLGGLEYISSTRPNDKDRMDFICSNPRWLICDRKGWWKCVNPFTQYEYPIFKNARDAVDWALGYRGGKE